MTGKLIIRLPEVSRGALSTVPDLEHTSRGASGAIVKGEGGGPGDKS